MERFHSVTVRMAKRQNLSLNPTKISGLCGRLMCCLAHEVDQYPVPERQATDADSGSRAAECRRAGRTSGRERADSRPESLLS